MKVRAFTFFTIDRRFIVLRSIYCIAAETIETDNDLQVLKRIKMDQNFDNKKGERIDSAVVAILISYRSGINCNKFVESESYL